jgi:hypothetical protein
MLYRYHHGELVGDERERVRLAIEADEGTRTRYQEILAAEAEFVVLPVPPAIRKLETPAARPWWLWLAPVGGLVALAAAALLVVGPMSGPADLHDPARDEVRTKGTLPDLEVWVGREQGTRPLRAGEAVAAGDQVQLTFHPQGHRLASFAGQDGTGALEMYGTVEVDPAQGLQPAPFALELDGAPGPQTFYVLAHDVPMTTSELEAAFRAGTGDVRTVVLPKR